MFWCVTAIIGAAGFLIFSLVVWVRTLLLLRLTKLSLGSKPLPYFLMTVALKSLAIACERFFSPLGLAQKIHFGLSFVCVVKL